MADYPPFMNAYGNIGRILAKIKEAKTPERFTQDFLATKLGFSGGGATSFIPFAKRIGFLATDGTPTDLYKRFRNPSQSGAAIGEAMKAGYSALYERNEYAHELDRKGLEGLIVESTGLDRGNHTLRAIISSFEALKGLADFEGKSPPMTEFPKELTQDKASTALTDHSNEEIRLNLSYTIYLNLPKTDDIAVFNAIFKSLRENFFRQ